MITNSEATKANNIKIQKFKNALMTTNTIRITSTIRVTNNTRKNNKIKIKN